MKKLLSYFLRGLLIFVPIVFTVFVLWWAFKGLDNTFRNIFKITIPGAGILGTILVIIIIGFLASNFAGRKFFAFIDSVFKKLPLVKLLYNSIKDLIEAFAGEKKRFDKPVLVTLSKDSGVKVVGFVTREDLSQLGLHGYVAVFLPQAYNYAGNTLIVPKEAVQPLNIDSSEAMGFVISGGVSGK